jgi:exosortase/archaeosortase family protein
VVTLLTAGSNRLARLSLRELVLWCILFFVTARISATLQGLSLVGLTEAIADHNLIYLLAYVAVVSRALQINASLPATGLDVVVLLAIVCMLNAISMLFVGTLDGLIALALGMYLLSMGRFRDISLRAVGVIFVAIGCNLFVGKVILMVFQSQIVAVDAFVVQHALWLTGDVAPRVANRVVSETGFAISIVGACSAFNNITLMVLAVVAGIMWVRPMFQRSDLFWLGIGALLLLILNTVRLGLMAQNYESYAYWHHEAGSLYIAIAQTSLVMLVAFLAAHAPRPASPQEAAT